jgi:PAS domain S-box-containing protein
MSEKRFEQLMEKVTDFAIIFKDADAVIQEWNIGAERLFGWSRAEAIGNPIQIIYTPEDLAKKVPENEMSKAIQDGFAGDDRWHIRKDGSYFFASGLLHPIFENGELACYIKMVRDLTQQVELQAAVEEARTSVDIRVEERTSALGEANKVLRFEMERQRRDDYLRLRMLQKMMQMQEDERRRISRDIHDHLGQELTAIRMHIQALNQGVAETPEIAVQVAKLKDLTERLDQTVDFIAWELRPNSIHEIGLVEALTKFVDEWAKQFNVPAEITTANLSGYKLDSMTELNLYRIAQESLNNIAKHAKASTVSVVLERRDGHVALVVEDNGRGFDVADSANRENGLGLLGMGERAALLRGKVEIESEPGKGTAVHVVVPANFESAEQGNI